MEVFDMNGGWDYRWKKTTNCRHFVYVNMINIDQWIRVITTGENYIISTCVQAGAP